MKSHSPLLLPGLFPLLLLLQPPLSHHCSCYCFCYSHHCIATAHATACAAATTSSMVLLQAGVVGGGAQCDASERVGSGGLRRGGHSDASE